MRNKTFQIWIRTEPIRRAVEMPLLMHYTWVKDIPAESLTDLVSVIKSDDEGIGRDVKIGDLVYDSVSNEYYTYTETGRWSLVTPIED